MRATYTSVPSNRNSFGRRTAWLRPERNIFAVLICAVIYTTSDDHSRIILRTCSRGQWYQIKSRDNLEKDVRVPI
jgi:hypothetical protein